MTLTTITGLHVALVTNTGLHVVLAAIAGLHVVLTAITGLNVAWTAITGLRVALTGNTGLPVTLTILSGLHVAQTAITGLHVALTIITGLHVALSAITGYIWLWPPLLGYHPNALLLCRVTVRFGAIFKCFAATHKGWEHTQECTQDWPPWDIPQCDHTTRMRAYQVSTPNTDHHETYPSVITPQDHICIYQLYQHGSNGVVTKYIKIRRLLVFLISYYT